MTHHPMPERSEKFCFEFSQWLKNELSSMGFNVVFATIHGSYLYGLAHEHSDIDGFAVLSPVDATRKTFTMKHNGLDVYVMTFDKFYTLIGQGSHQAVEALYSPYAAYTDSPYTPMVKSTHPHISSSINKARSAARSFEHRGRECGDTKSLNHSKRLYHSSLQHFQGTYTPVYTMFCEQSR